LESDKDGDGEERKEISEQSAGEDAAVPQYMRLKKKK